MPVGAGRSLNTLPANDVSGTETGDRTLWKTLAPSDPAGVPSINAVSLSSDGRFYAYSFDRTLSDLYLVEGVR